MLSANVTINTIMENRKKALPPGRIKIENALLALLEKKDFNAITTAEIAQKAGVTEPLIYKYFKCLQNFF